MAPVERITDTRLKSLIKKPRTKQVEIVDGSVSGLVIRLGTREAATWSISLRVSGEGGVSVRGRAKKGPKRRYTLGSYPELSIEMARAKASEMRALARGGKDPASGLKGAGTADSISVSALSEDFVRDHVRSRELDSADKYQNAFDTHINPKFGAMLAELFTREDARKLMSSAREKRKRPNGGKGGALGGVEAARTVMGVLRHMYSWAIEERRVRRTDNPCSHITKNLPKKKQGDVVLTLEEARIVWQAAAD